MTWTGEVRLGLTRRGGRTVATEQFCHGALKVMRPSYETEAQVPRWTLMNPGGGYVEGDRYSVRIRLGPGSATVIDAQAATKIYRCERDEARQRTAVTLGSGSVLTLRPRPLIAYRDARYVQDTVVEMDPTARFCSRELITAGWSPDATPFSFDCIRLRLTVRFTDQSLALVDNLVLQPTLLDLRSPTVLAGHSHLGTLAMVGSHVPAFETVRSACRLADPNDCCRSAVGGVAGRSVLVRCLGETTEQVDKVLLAAESVCSCQSIPLQASDHRRATSDSSAARSRATPSLDRWMSVERRSSGSISR